VKIRWSWVVALLLVMPCAAADFPNKPVRLIVPFTPGGGADLVGRVVAEKLTEKWGQPVIVENRPGAGGNLAAKMVATAAPDGYTLFQYNVANAIAPSVYRNLNYDPLKDFAAVGRLGSSPLLLVAQLELPARNLEQLIAYARANPSKLTYASSGTGGSTHLLGELFNTLAGTKIVHVPYKGGLPGITDLLGGRVDLMFVTPASGLQHVSSGKLRALGVSSAKRSSLAPNIPTIAEAGVPGFDASAWYGLVAPAGTPVSIVEQINRDIRAVLQQRDVRDRFAAEGVEIEADTPAQFSAFLRTEVERWHRVAASAGVEPE
jgi:tripartite-type tricarboxylate transporter receptor subunit TctC